MIQVHSVRRKCQERLKNIQWVGLADAFALLVVFAVTVALFYNDRKTNTTVRACPLN